MFKKLKQYKSQIIISSIITILPIIVGLCLWNKLPEQLPTHWNGSGKIDGYSSKPFAVFFIPLFLLAMQWVCIFFTTQDPKNKGQNAKAMSIIFWIIPVVSVVCFIAIYSASLGKEIGAETIMPALISVLFIILGNYFPKINQNTTLGIKVPWTLNDEENWNKTHRFAGKLWVIGGIIMLASAFLPSPVSMTIFFAVIVVLAVVPMIYSYVLYKKKLKNQ